MMLGDDRLLAPETILPAQSPLAGAPCKTFRPVHQLMSAVLEDAIHILCKGQRRRRVFREADEWIESLDRSWVFSFERICEALDLDADRVRRAVRESQHRCDEIDYQRRGFPAVTHFSNADS